MATISSCNMDCYPFIISSKVSNAFSFFVLILKISIASFFLFKGIIDGSKGGSRAKTELARNPDFIGILDDISNQIQPTHPSGDRSGYNVNPSFIGHPKLVKLRDIVLEHFRTCDGAQHAGNTKGSRVMIFSQYRDSVQEISRMLSQYKPLVKVMSFIGQQSKGNTSKGLTQKEQLEVCYFILPEIFPTGSLLLFLYVSKFMMWTFFHFQPGDTEIQSRGLQYVGCNVCGGGRIGYWRGRPYRLF